LGSARSSTGRLEISHGLVFRKTEMSNLALQTDR